jgi:hypothetical protein
MKKQKVFDCVQLMQKIREELSLKYKDNFELQKRDLDKVMEDYKKSRKSRTKPKITA